MSFVTRTYSAWALAMLLTAILSWTVISWAFVPLFAIMFVVFSFVQCNNCGHNAAADAKGDGRILTNSCAKCGASLEDVYPFSYVRKMKKSAPP
jgi:hypothetical protein